MKTLVICGKGKSEGPSCDLDGHHEAISRRGYVRHSPRYWPNEWIHMERSATRCSDGEDCIRPPSPKETAGCPIATVPLRTVTGTIAA